MRAPLALLLTLILVTAPFPSPIAGDGSAPPEAPLHSFAPAVFNNPVISTGSPDPFIHKGRDGFYYMLSTNASKITVIASCRPWV